MSVLVCGSLAYDTLLHFDGAFSDHLLPDQLHKLSVCFKVPRLRRCEFGGCAGNIVSQSARAGRASLPAGQRR